MSPQADYVVSNGTGAAVRSDINGQLAAIVSNNSGATEPATMYAYQWWADTTTGLLKIRNSANNAWVTVGTLASANLGLAALASPTFTGTVTAPTFTASTAVNIPLGSAGSPTLFFTGDSNTGIYSPGADQVAVATNGVGRLFVDASGNVTVGTTTAPGSNGKGIALYDASFPRLSFRNSTTGDANTDGTQMLMNGNNFIIANTENGYTSFENNGSERLRITSDGKLLVGTSTSRGNNFNSASGQNLQFQIEGTDYLTSGASFTSNSTSVGHGPHLVFNRSRGTTIGSNTVVQSGDLFGYIGFQGNDGSEFVEGATIKAEVDGTPGANDMPGRLTFSTTADGASSPTERMRITSTGAFKAQTQGTSYENATSSINELTGSINDTLMAFRNTSGTINGARGGIDIQYTAANPNSTTACFLQCNSSGPTVRAEIRSNGGLANFSANNANLSDRNAKKDISPAADTWDCIKEWEIVNYRYKDQPDGADPNLGVIAQQVAESCPEVITVFSGAKEAKSAVLDDDGNEVEPAQEAQPEKLGVKEQQMYWMAIKALQEAQVRIEQLETEMTAVKAQLA